MNTCDVIKERRPYVCLSPSWCVLCKRSGENIYHILLHCAFVQKVWVLIFELFGLVGAFPRRWADFIALKWQFKEGNCKMKGLWRVTALAMTWVVWLERNRRIFEERSSTVAELWNQIRFLVGLWAKASNFFDSAERFLFGLDCFSFLCWFLVWVVICFLGCNS